MKKLLYAALAASAFIVSSPLSAGQEEFRVTAFIPKLADWTAATSDNLSRSLKRTNIDGISAGVTAVQFECDEDGNPANLHTSMPSGNPFLDAAARGAVRRMKSMHPLPAGLVENQRFEAIILVARDQHDLNQQLASLSERADRQNTRLAAGTAPNPVLAFAAISTAR